MGSDRTRGTDFLSCRDPTERQAGFLLAGPLWGGSELEPPLPQELACRRQRCTARGASPYGVTPKVLVGASSDLLCGSQGRLATKNMG